MFCHAIVFISHAWYNRSRPGRLLSEMQSEESGRVFEELPVAEALRVMIVPTVMSQLIVLMYNMADTFFVGRTGNPYMVASTSLVLPVFNMTLCLAGLAGVGGGALVSRLLGRGMTEEASKVSSFSIYLALAVAALFSLLVLVFLDPLLSALGASGNTMEYSRQYALCVIVAGGIPNVLSNVLSNLIRSVGRSKEAGRGIMFGGLLNIVLDPIFMFLIMPDGYEVLGAGIATCLSSCMTCVYFFAVMFRIRKNSVVSFRFAGMPLMKSVSAIFSVGIPSAVATLLFDLDYVVIDRLMSGYSDFALAAIGVVLKVERLPLNIGVGICQGMMPLVAYCFSSGNRKRMDRAIGLSLRTGLVAAAVSIVFYELFARQLIMLFIKDETTIAMATVFLRIRVLATPLMFSSFFTVYLFQAFGMGRKSLLLGIMRWLVFNIPMLFILDCLVGMYGLVLSQIVADTLTVIFSIHTYRRFKPCAASPVVS